MALAVDAQGNAFATGRGFRTGRGDEYITLKLAGSDGEILWDDMTGGDDFQWDVAWDIVVGPDGHPVVTGIVRHSDSSASYRTIKLDKDDATRLWDVTEAGAVNVSARVGWLEVADNGDIFMVNKAYSSSTGYDIALRRYAAANGAVVWTERYNSGGSTADEPGGMIRTANGDLIVVGVTSGDYMTVLFDGDTGDDLWTSTYSGPPNWWDVARCAIEGPAGEIIVSGSSDGGVGFGNDAATVAYDTATGDELWALRWDGIGELDAANAVIVSNQYDLYVAGHSYNGTESMNQLAKRYQMDDLSPVEHIPSIVTRLSAWPNPFNPRVAFTFDLAESSRVRLGVFDMRGRRVDLLSDEFLAVGEHTRHWDGRDEAGRSLAAGVYVARLESDAGQKLIKVVLAK